MSPVSTARPRAGTAATAREALARRAAQVREATLALTAGLGPEDQCVQSMPDASPVKWHLAHTSWFFEAVVLGAHSPGYRPFDESFARLFNSYYESLGPRHPRPQRGLLTRPSRAEVHRYRAEVDARLETFIETAGAATWAEASRLLELGLHHEQQHQELILTDILHALSCNPLLPAYQALPALRVAHSAQPLRWLDGPHGIVQAGHAEAGFAFDNETPRHSVLLQPYRIADRLVTCGEFLEFIQDGGYSQPALWLSDGWAMVQAQGWRAPAYWLEPGDPRAPVEHWQVFGLGGVRALDPAVAALAKAAGGLAPAEDLLDAFARF